MIRYEYEEDDSDQLSLPRLYPDESHEVKHETEEYDWLNLVDPFTSDVLGNENLSLDQYHADQFQAFGHDDFSGLNQYIENVDEPAQFVDSKDWYTARVDVSEDAARVDGSFDDVPVEVVKRPKKKIKQPLTRRPIDEYKTANGYKKPNFSYSCLIGLALRNAEDGELTVSEIYRFLCHHFPFFREAPSGWKNSVRHNLSLNKCFEKVEVEVADAQGRKSCLWRMNPTKGEKMEAEIQKWRERSSSTIGLAMITPSDLEPIIEGRMGMPAPHIQYTDAPAEQRPRKRLLEPKVVVIRTDLPRADDYRYVEKPSYHQEYPMEEMAHYEPEDMNFMENVEPFDPQAQTITDPLPSTIRTTSALDPQYHMQPSTSHGTYLSPAQVQAQSAHQRAARTLESLLERKKQATTHPLDNSHEEEDQALSPRTSEERIQPRTAPSSYAQFRMAHPVYTRYTQPQNQSNISLTSSEDAIVQHNPRPIQTALPKQIQTQDETKVKDEPEEASEVEKKVELEVKQEEEIKQEPQNEQPVQVKEEEPQDLPKTEQKPLPGPSRTIQHQSASIIVRSSPQPGPSRVYIRQPGPSYYQEDTENVPPMRRVSVYKYQPAYSSDHKLQRVTGVGPIQRPRHLVKVRQTPYGAAVRSTLTKKKTTPGLP
ncbi:unnamed protein product [Bursaphelenchus xylophilus]|uniref:(pine wood nematode) hypothetical protein n=1 Tax=Bursaphelenchus xylophilus TaxID=6326 RepID=A0A1I7RJ37_BURXY|nr:unnamed protein product [Bursaphelenchus xylophilus]CAG9119319.1 unnamed protein product [Bursaphelenchus xylophilus]